MKQSLGDIDESELRLMLDSVTDTEIIMLDPKGIIRSWNHGAENLKGYKAEEVIGKSVALFYTEEDCAAGMLHRELEQAARQGRYEFEGWRVRKDGQRIWANILLQPMRNSQGKLTGFVKVVRDTSESRRAQERFRAVVESAPTAMVMIDKGGEIVLVNAQAEKLFGYPRSEMMGKRIEMLVPTAMRERHPGLRNGFFEDPRPRAMGIGRDLFGVRKDGTEIPVEIGLNPISTNDGNYVLAAIADITERKRAEEKFRAVVESAPNAMVMITGTGEIVLVNSQAERLFGYARSEMIGKAVEMLVPERFRVLHPGHRSNYFSDPMPRMMGMGRDLFGVRKDGSEVPIEIGLNPIETGEGRFVLAAIADITERVDRDQLLKKQRDEIIQLSTPVMQVWERVLALPIIGTLDSQRAARLTENLLQKIAAEEAEFVILDISGVPAIDSQVAENLLKTVQGARLMGAESIISGVRPETAQAMVHLGIDIGTLRSRATLRDALQLAIKLRRDIEDRTARSMT